VLDQTCITYPETYARDMLGSEIKLILEDVADNLFNPDPYYQQGGDMVRVGGLDYAFDPLKPMGQRITDLTLNSGERLVANKKYRVSGWATVGSKAPGEPIWDTVAKYMKQQKSISIKKLNTPKIKGLKGNKGIVI
ncbi:MAG: 5'-nucleotidase C-terminal domain-containing protein, partial [Kangiellaceae bacterium]|jgi:sulfur-oxidizing protein SoxB|nr:5'-nucleotidase C-terminal domain-containing protein [Kangiellaceae bacterium]